MTQIVGPEMTAATLRSEVVARELAVALQLDPDAFIKTSEEIEAERLAAQNQSLVENLGPDVIRSASTQSQ
jgi:hypothetical protein